MLGKCRNMPFFRNLQAEKSWDFSFGRFGEDLEVPTPSKKKRTPRCLYRDYRDCFGIGNDII